MKQLSEKKKAQLILDCLEEEYPLADTQLHYQSVFELLIAVVLSAQCTDKRVNLITEQLYRQYRTPQDFVQLPLVELEGKIKSAGLYHSKAKNIKALSQMILTDFQGQVPSNFEDLLKLPGVGRKTANVVLAVGFQAPGLGVDTHVLRVTARLGLAEGISPENTEMTLKALIPPERWGRAHHLFIFHGRNICKARKPFCERCILQKQCPSYPIT